jgi:hypothetical protein
MKPKFTRRELALAAATGAIAAHAQVTTQPGGVDPAKEARDLNARNVETLTKFEIPISTEPAFQFKA